MTQYPAGGPREPVYQLMRNLGFSMSKWSDKYWKAADGIEVQIYGTGSMARVSHGPTNFGECALADLGGKLERMRLGT